MKEAEPYATYPTIASAFCELLKDQELFFKPLNDPL